MVERDVSTLFAMQQLVEAVPFSPHHLTTTKGHPDMLNHVTLEILHLFPVPIPSPQALTHHDYISSPMSFFST